MPSDGNGGGASKRPEARGMAIVGIGASAGGFTAINAFLEHMPTDSGLGFVVVLHLDPQKESHAAEVLAPHTDMPVVQIEDGMPVEPNRVHVIVPDRSLTIAAGILHLTQLPKPRGDRHPIDTFFEALAEDQKERAIAIIFSGTGSNGSEGARTIRARGGTAFVQDPETAEFTGMPRSAIAVGAADYILAPAAMPEALLKYVHHPYITAGAHQRPLPESDVERMKEILSVLHTRGGHDFRGYRTATITRRIQRRMGLAHVLRMKEYAALLREHPEEVTALVHDLLINVTGFFRDGAAWEVLHKEVIAPLVATGAAEDPIRAWVPACSNGAEAYSIGMLLIEECERTGRDRDLKIFATDAVANTLEVARRGAYPASMVSDIPAARLTRFFDRTDDGYVIKTELREMLVFAPQNLLQDPPFSKLDLVSCRNVLIYLEPDIQQRLLRLFHYTLREGGYLFLGSSESIGREYQLFTPVTKRWRIYRRGAGATNGLNFPIAPARNQRAAAEAGRATPRVTDQARHLLLERYGPAAVVIDEAMQVLHFHGAVDPYLSQPQGAPSTDVLTLAREGLRLKLGGAVRRALEKNQPVMVDDAHVRRGNRFQRVVIEAIPLRGGPPRHQLVTFRDFAEGEQTRASDPPRPAQGREQDLQEQLQATRDELQSTVEELETSNEEMRASSEEVVSMNEELQSANEELETSKEELQSLNEELSTLNAQLQAKVDELENSANDLANLFANTEVATVFLDPQLRIRNFTPAATKLFDLLPTDVGRPITHFAQRFTGRDMVGDLKAVLDRLIPLEAEVRSDQHRLYLRRTMPYRTRDRRIDGVVLTFVDITDRILAEQAITRSRQYADRIVETVGVGLLVLDPEQRIRSANPWFYDTFGVSPEETLGSVLWDVGRAQWGHPRADLERVVRDGETVEHATVEVELAGGEKRTLVLDARTLIPENTTLLVLRDVTEHQRFTEHLANLNKALEQRIEQSSAIVQLLVEQIATAANKARTVVEALEFAVRAVAENQGWAVGHVYWRRDADPTWVPSDIWYVRDGYDASNFQQATRETKFEHGQGTVGRVGSTGQPLWNASATDDARWKRSAFQPAATMLFPVTGRERSDVDAVFEFYSAVPFEPDPAFLALTANIGMQLGHVFERKRLERQLATLSEQEQRRIGQELHDQVGQSISAVAMLARSLQRRLDEGAPVSAADLTAVLDAAQEAKVQVRFLTRSLLPEEMGAQGLANALEDLAVRFSSMHQVACRFEKGYQVLITDEQQAIQLFRIAQEAVLNAAQHSDAKEIIIRLFGENHSSVLEVRDDGLGFAGDTIPATGMGVRIMRHRATLIGAQLDISSVNGAGTLVRCVLPNSR